MRIAVVTLALALAAAACTSSSESSSVTAVPATGVPESLDRCQDVPRPILDFLEEGLTISNGSLGFGKAVQSNDYDGLIYAVAAEIDDDLDYAGDGDIGVWGVRYINVAGEGAAGALAVQGSLSEVVWAPTVDLDIIVTEFVDGVRSAEACALEEVGLLLGG